MFPFSGAHDVCVAASYRVRHDGVPPRHWLLAPKQVHGGLVSANGGGVGVQRGRYLPLSAGPARVNFVSYHSISWYLRADQLMEG